MTTAQKPSLNNTGTIGIHVGAHIVEVVLPNGDEIHISHRDWLEAAALIPQREPRLIPAVQGG
jgi:hypothetical protein